MTGSWTCHGVFQGSGLNHDIWLLKEDAQQQIIVDTSIESCEVDLTIPAGLYLFTSRLPISVTDGQTSIPDDGLSVTKHGSYEFTITLPN